MTKTIVGSIVTYNPNWDLLKETVTSFLNSIDNALVVIWDNSEQDTISTQLAEFKDKVIYHKSPQNFGYGKGNNQVFQRYSDLAPYFCVLNPDLSLPKESLPRLLQFMNTHEHWGLITGRICNTKGTTDPVHKLLPSFIRYGLSFSARKFFKFHWDKKIDNAFLNLQEGPSRLPILSGCFLLFKTAHYEELQGFDERFFLYFEDWDLSLRSFLTGKSLILPDIDIHHAWARQSHKKWTLFLVHLRSAFTFYKKWGFGFKISKLANNQAGYFAPTSHAPDLSQT